MLQNAYFLAKIGVDTAENERHFAEILPIDRRVALTGEEGSGDGRGLQVEELDAGDVRFDRCLPEQRTL